MSAITFAQPSQTAFITDSAGATWVTIGPDFGADLADVKAMIEAGVPR